MLLALRFWLSLISFSGASQTGHLLNALAAKVGNEYLTVQDAYIFRALQRYRTNEKPFIIFEKEQALKRTIEKIMFEKMLLAEVKTVDFKDPEPSKAKEFVRSQESSAKKAGFSLIAKEFDLSQDELMKILQKNLLAEAFLQKKIATLTPVITESEVDAYMLRYPEKVKKLSGEKRSVVADVIKQERASKALQDYIDFLSEKYSAAFLFS